ncbi:hypothetical protein Ahy_A02g008103 [Arachis hypogaea]|uniref:BED-type domain-containing protein n=1 Tax=Arachis hypogaea TaxID=3818 RepID=A0A445EE20_ARAHY|nr:hypothetical protein Ahy_A02g008103 [Arachis hypogaea]
MSSSSIIISKLPHSHNFTPRSSPLSSSADGSATQDLSRLVSTLQSPRRISASHSVPQSQFLSSSVPQFLTATLSLSLSHPNLLTSLNSIVQQPQLELQSYVLTSVWPSSLLPAGLGPGLLGLVSRGLSSESTAPRSRSRLFLVLGHGYSTLSVTFLGSTLAIQHLQIQTWLQGNMNSETVSNLVTIGVGSKAAPVEVDEPSSKRLRPTTSDVWNFFKKLSPDMDGVERAECKGCKKVFKAGGKRYGTPTIKRHLDSCTQIKHEDIEKDKDQEDIAKGEGYSSGVGSNDVIDLYEDEDEN